MNNILNTIYMNFIKLPKEIYSYNSNLNIFLKPNIHNIIGLYDENQNIWYNAWSLYNNNNNLHVFYKKSKELLIYGVDIDKHMLNYSLESKMILRSILINSKIYITDKDLQLSIILAIICYFTKSIKYIILIEKNISYYIIENK